MSQECQDCWETQVSRERQANLECRESRANRAKAYKVFQVSQAYLDSQARPEPMVPARKVHYQSYQCIAGIVCIKISKLYNHNYDRD